MKVPSVHLNGTSGEELLKRLWDAVAALDKARSALHEITPNARDYYVQGEGVFTIAMHEHMARLKKVESIINELVEIFEVVGEQRTPR
jgi:hypothetical protein